MTKLRVLPLLSLLCLSPFLTAKEIAITFDDAPLPGSKVMSGSDKTKMIIQHLQENNVPDALFFVTARNIVTEADKKRLKQYTDAGFHLAHHSYDHLSAKKIEADAYLADFDKADKVLSSFDSVLKLHRFPFLHYGKSAHKRKAIHSHLQQKGYDIGYVTVDNYDWYLNSKLLSAQHKGLAIDYERLGDLYVDTLWQSIQFYDGVSQQHLNRSAKHVLLLHENEMAALYLGKLIQHLKAQGWKVISPQQAYQDPIAKAYDPEKMSFNNQGRVAAVAHQQGADKKKLHHKSEDTEYLDIVFEQYNIIKK